MKNTVADRERKEEVDTPTITRDRPTREELGNKRTELGRTE